MWNVEVCSLRVSSLTGKIMGEPFIPDILKEKLMEMSGVLHCGICGKLPDDPHQFSKCQHMSCKNCIPLDSCTTRFRKDITCPKCLEISTYPLESIVEDNIIYKLICICKKIVAKLAVNVPKYALPENVNESGYYIDDIGDRNKLMKFLHKPSYNYNEMDKKALHKIHTSSNTCKTVNVGPSQEMPLKCRSVKSDNVNAFSSIDNVCKEAKVKDLKEITVTCKKIKTCVNKAHSLSSAPNICKAVNIKAANDLTLKRKRSKSDGTEICRYSSATGICEDGNVQVLKEPIFKPKRVKSAQITVAKEILFSNDSITVETVHKLSGDESVSNTQNPTHITSKNMKNYHCHSFTKFRKKMQLVRKNVTILNGPPSRLKNIDTESNLDTQRSNSKTMKKKSRGTRVSLLGTKLSRTKIAGQTSGSVQKLVIDSPKRLKTNRKGESLLHTACIQKDEVAVNTLILEGADVNAQDYAKWTPLHEAASRGFVALVKSLLRAGALVDVPGEYNITPLHDAVLNNQLEVVKLLVKHKANVNARNSYGKSPKDCASSEEMKEALNRRYSPPECMIAEPAYSPSSEGCILLYAHNISCETRLQLLSFISEISVCGKQNVKLLDSYSTIVTHVITETSDDYVCQPTVFMLLAMQQGITIISTHWINGWKEDPNPLTYQVRGTKQNPNSGAPNRARENFVLKRPGLFNGCHIYLRLPRSFKITHTQINQDVIHKTDLVILIKTAGGAVLSREPDPENIPDIEKTYPYHANASGSLSQCSHYIIYRKGDNGIKYNMPHVKAFPWEWLLLCLEFFTLDVQSNY